MATIETRQTPDGKTSYRVKIRIRGFPSQSATFERKDAGDGETLLTPKRCRIANGNLVVGFVSDAGWCAGHD